MNLPGARLVVLFFAAYSATCTLHELSHALTAYALGVPATLFHFFANIDREHVTQPQLAWIRAVGPVASLGFGLVFWLVSRSLRGRPHELTFLYLAIFGVSFFLGNTFSIAFVGDFSRIAELLEIPQRVRYAIALTAAIALCAFNYFVGRELARWAPVDAGRGEAVTRLVVVPVVVGTALVLLAYIPMPGNFVMGWITPSVFWIFAAIGVWRASNTSGSLLAWGGPIRKGDIVFALGAVITVRILTTGLHLMR